MKRRIALVSLFSLLAAAVVVTYSVPSASAFVFGPGAAANGHGNLTLDDGSLRTFSFHANTRKNGTATGSVTLHNREDDVFIRADIQCLKVVGTTATMSGPITNSSNDDFEGRTGIFKVEDNGEGSSSAGDRLSRFFILPANSPINCNSPFNPFMELSEGGNIQVKP